MRFTRPRRTVLRVFSVTALALTGFALSKPAGAAESSTAPSAPGGAAWSLSHFGDTPNDQGIAVNPGGSIYVASYGTGIEEFAYPGAKPELLPVPKDAIGVAFDVPTNQLIFTDGSGVFSANPDGTDIKPIGGNWVQPWWVSTDAKGRIIVEDAGNQTVSVMAPDGGDQRIVASDIGSFSGIAADRNGYLYIANTANGTVLRQRIDGGEAQIIAKGMSSPNGAAVGADGRLYIDNSGAGTVVAMDRDGANVKTIASGLGRNWNLVVDEKGRVLSTGDDTVTVLSPDGTRPTVVPGDGQATVSWSAPANDGGSPITAYIVVARSETGAGVKVPFEANVNEGVVDGLSNGSAYTFFVYAINAHGASPASEPTDVTTIGVTKEIKCCVKDQGDPTPVTNPTQARDAGNEITLDREYKKPTGTATDPATGIVYVLDANGDVIQYDHGSHNVIASGLNQPMAIAVGPRGDLFITVQNGGDGRDSVVELHAESWKAETIASDLSAPYGITVDPKRGIVYVSEAGNGAVIGLLPVGDSGEWKEFEVSGPGTLTQPTGITFSGNQLFVAETTDVTSFAMTAPDEPTSWTRGPIVADGFTNLSGGLTSDAAGNLYAAETGDHRIVEISPNPDATSKKDAWLTTTLLKPSSDEILGLTVDPSGRSIVFTNTAKGELHQIVFAPLPATNVVATADDGTLVVSWDAPISDGGAAVNHYVAVAQPGGQQCESKGEHSCVISGLKNGVDYQITVYDDNGVSKAMTSPIDATPQVVSAALPGGGPLGILVIVGGISLFGISVVAIRKLRQHRSLS